VSDDNRALYEAATAGDLATELDNRGLPKSGAKPELVDRLLEHDAAQATAPAADPDPEQGDGQICGLCWPAGWPENHDRASCSHGDYTC
jgi:hypothetical protein